MNVYVRQTYSAMHAPDMQPRPIYTRGNKKRRVRHAHHGCHNGNNAEPVKYKPSWCTVEPMPRLYRGISRLSATKNRHCRISFYLCCKNYLKPDTSVWRILKFRRGKPYSREVSISRVICLVRLSLRWHNLARFDGRV